MDDIANSMTAGALVGAMSEIPAFLRSKVVTKADVLLAEQVGQSFKFFIDIEAKVIVERRCSVADSSSCILIWLLGLHYRACM